MNDKPDSVQSFHGAGSTASAILSSTPGPKYVSGRSHKETATAIRKDLLRQKGPLEGVSVEVRRSGAKSLLLTFTHHTGRKEPVTAAWLASPAGQEAEMALHKLLMEYRDGVLPPKTPSDPVPLSWVIATLSEVE